MFLVIWLIFKSFTKAFSYMIAILINVELGRAALFIYLIRL